MGQKPPVTISSLYEARLEKILASLDRNLLPNGEELQTELDRANIVAPEEMPPDVVTMNSTVIFRMQPSNRAMLRLYVDGAFQDR